MKLRDAAEKLDYSKKHVQRLGKTGVLKTTLRPNGQYDYDLLSVMQLAKANAVKAGKRRFGGNGKKAVIYVRCSHGGEEEVQNQLDRAWSWSAEHCEEHALAMPEQEYVDYYGGDEWKKRPGFERLFEDVKCGLIDRIYALSPDRFYRGDSGFLKYVFGSYGVEILFQEANLRPMTAEEQRKQDRNVADYSEARTEYFKRNGGKIKAANEYQNAEWAELIPKARELLEDLRARDAHERKQYTVPKNATFKADVDFGVVTENKRQYTELKGHMGLYDGGCRHRTLLSAISTVVYEAL